MADLDPGRMRDHLATYAYYVTPARRLLRIQLLVIALLIGAVGLYVGGSVTGTLVDSFTLALLPVMAVLAIVAWSAPARWLGPSDPTLEIVPVAGGLRFVARSGARVDLRWADPNFRLRFLDYSATTTASHNVIRVVPAGQDRITGGIDGQDFDALVDAAHEHGMTVSTFERRRWLRPASQVITETWVGPPSGTTPVPA